METYTNGEIQILKDGTVRIYGNGGLVSEFKFEYLITKIQTDAQQTNPSGTVKS